MSNGIRKSRKPRPPRRRTLDPFSLTLAQPSAPLSNADGQQLAVQMLREIEDAGGDEVDFDYAPWYRFMRQQTYELVDDAEVHRYWEDRQDNLVLRYLDAIKGDRALLEGFASTLTDCLASWRHSGEPNLDYYERMEVNETGPGGG